MEKSGEIDDLKMGWSARGNVVISNSESFGFPPCAEYHSLKQNRCILDIIIYY